MQETFHLEVMGREAEVQVGMKKILAERFLLTGKVALVIVKLVAGQRIKKSQRNKALRVKKLSLLQALGLTFRTMQVKIES